MKTISSAYQNKKFNFRVGAFILDLSNNYILLHKKKNSNYWMLPGGRLEYGESTDDAIKREIREELGLDVNPKLVLITENFFSYNEEEVHEIDFDFICQYEEKVNIEHEFSGLEGEYLIFKWVNKENIKNYNIIISTEKEYIMNYAFKENKIEDIKKYVIKKEGV